MRLLLTADPEIEVPPRLYGGIERIVDVLVRRLKAMGHRVGLVAREGSTTPADVFYPWPGKSSLSRGDTLANMWALWKAKRDFRPDLLHSFSRIAYLAPDENPGLPEIREGDDLGELIARAAWTSARGANMPPSPTGPRITGRLSSWPRTVTACSRVLTSRMTRWRSATSARSATLAAMVASS